MKPVRETEGPEWAATLRQAERREAGQGGVWCQHPGAQWEEGQHAGRGQLAGP